MYMHVYIYIYIYIYICSLEARESPTEKSLRPVVRRSVRSHAFDSQHLSLRVSNLRASAYVHLKVPFGSSNLPGAGPIFPD